ncbi:hypothetical protein J5N97_029068 [Dioscorea zingiberensis]|uniref:RING-type E3 ubiquitin transferase n=1 Tax=Dioscorea zingiberensis TaxID=325984 RepID=A0A9D5H5A3_9LILI|nr:hypothetical protein J5N97_029068 [Dioscorea zingiberensis]
MSSTGGAPGAAAAPAGQQRYFCHQCDRTVVLTPDPSSDLSCPLCGGGFIEEFDLPANPNPSPSPSPNASPFLAFSSSLSPFFSSSSAPIIFSAPPSFDLRRPSDLAGLLGTDASPRSRDSGGGPEPFNPMFFLQNYLNSLVAGGANIQVVLEGGPPAGGSLGDYFIGPGLEQFIQQLAENDPNRHGTPPASKSAIQALPDVVISAQLLASDEAQCATENILRSNSKAAFLGNISTFYELLIVYTYILFLPVSYCHCKRSDESPSVSVHLKLTTPAVLLDSQPFSSLLQ